jgi:2-polyprenyl-3-methyl-5-hydroxy-6-metoxy-1,4-benzoquinol methylase
MDPCPLCASRLEPPRIAAPDRWQETPGSFEVATCSRCGAGVTLPRVSANQLAAFYPSGYAAYARSEGRVVKLISWAIRWWQGVRVRRSLPLIALRDRPPGRCLDVGAGRGDLSAMLQSRGWMMTAIDPSREAIEAAQARKIDARAGVVAAIELERSAYDAVIFQHSLEHTIDPVDDLRRVHRALVPGGLVLVSVPNFACWQRRRLGTAWFHLDLPRHRVHFTERALREALGAAGFVVRDISVSTSTVGLWASLQYRIFGRCLFRDGLKLRVAAGLCVLGLPLARLADHRGGGGDMLHVVAVK